jgi:hypothetical protein
MAKKIKISLEQRERFVRSELKRKQGVRTKRRYYLIVCEGAKTEPNYFEGLKSDLPKGVLTAFQIDIEGTGRNTMSLIDEAVRLKNVYEKQTGRPVDKLWTVFDKDSFSANDFNNAIHRCKNSRPEIGCAWSNEAFELWYLLHLQYQGMIEQNLREYVGPEYRYEKNSKEMYMLLKAYGRLEIAVRNAKRLAAEFEGREDYANLNPATMVHKLVIELFNLEEEV